MRKKYWIITVVLSVLLAMFITFEITYITMSELSRKKEASLASQYDSKCNELESSYEQYYTDLIEDRYDSPFMQKLAIIDYYYSLFYAGEIDEVELEECLANAYIDAVGDKFGAYYTADDFTSFMQESNGSLYGIGISAIYNKEHTAIEILTVFEGSPADKAGLNAGDVIVAVDGKRVSVENYYESVNSIKGEKGTSVNLTILRGEAEKDYSVIRDEIKIIAVTSHKYALDNTIGIIRISEFNENVPLDLKNELSKFIDEGINKIVFDLRNNPGGRLDAVVTALDYLLPEGDIVYVTDADGNVQRTYKSDTQCVKNVEFVVLVNENTASAGELFSAALRDYEMAKLVGVQTYGKGSMQTIYRLPDGSGISLTTNKYNPPSNVNYDKIGLVPDEVVELDEKLKDKNFYKIMDEEDNQLLIACRILGYNN